MQILEKGILVLVALLFPLISHAEEWEALLKEFEQYAEESRVASQSVGMSIAIVKDGKRIYAKGFGVRSINDSQPVTPETLFQIGSMTKSFTTALTALAVDRKLLKWENPVIQWVPTFLMYDPWVTREFQIEDLYAQRSGLVHHVGDNQAILGVSADQMIANLHYFAPVTSFRSSFAYQNIFFNIGGLALLKATGKSWQDLLKEEIFRPLGMKSSSADLSSYLKVPNRVGWHALKEDGTVELIPETAVYAGTVYTFAAAGGINSTVLDMSEWIMMQADSGEFQGKRIISKENLSRTHLAHIYAGNVNGIESYYCLGWGLQEYSPHPIIRHDGGTLGASNNMAIIPEERLGIVILCNTRESILSAALILKFFDLYYKKPKVDWTKKLLDDQKKLQALAVAKKAPIANPLPALPLNAYTGTYTNPVYGDLLITVRGNDLIGQIGPRKTEWIFKHYNRDAFSFWWPPFEEGTRKVLFYMDAQNKPSQVFIEALSGEKQELFVRKSEETQRSNKETSCASEANRSITGL
jgi:CubicO group peptidase (beta-lactamase class C family)